MFFLQDQVAMLKGLLALFEATQDEALLRRAQALAGFLQTRFADGQGLYLARAGSTEGLPAAGRRPVDDNLLLARTFLRLEAFSGEEAWRDRARGIAAKLCTPAGLDAQGRWLGEAILLLAELKEEAPHLVVTGTQADPRTQKLMAAARRVWAPGLARLRHDPALGAPLNPQLSFPALEQPAAFLCGNGTCSKPLLTEEDLQAEMKRRRR